MDDREQMVVRYVLERNAREHADHAAVAFEDGTSWTAAESWAVACRSANSLRALGVEAGDLVAMALPNGPDFFRVWWGATTLGAIVVPLNPSWRGRVLQHVLHLSGTKLVVGNAEFLEQVQKLDLPPMRTLSPDAVDGDDTTPPKLERPIEPWDIALCQFTSGTTGRSKAVQVPHNHLYVCGRWVTVDRGLGPDDVFLVDLPLSHMTALCVAAISMVAGCTIAVRSTPSISRYWEVLRETGATASFLMSSMVVMLLQKEPSPADRDHRVRLMVAAPLPPNADEFKERFGVEQLITGFGSSEVPAFIYQVGDRAIVPGSCGYLRPGFEVRLVDEHDREVAVGDPGEAVVRPEQPWSMLAGYLHDPEATASAWRNGWFHTGDQLTCDADGNYFFIDRKTDSLRRRGENISSFEVEVEVLAYESVREVACVAVASETGVEHEIKAFVVTEPDYDLDPHKLVEFLVDRMPYYMVPRYYEVVDELPKSPSMKVQKYLLRQRENSIGTWDLERDGRMKVTRQGLVPV